MAHQQTLPADTELIGDFRIVDLLGSGGFANTYLAMDLTLGREVAIKEFFPSELAVRADSQSVSVKSAAQKVQFDWAKGRFVREAKTLAKFRHPSVVRVFRVFNANDTAYIVLEFVRGANMETWLKRIQRRPDQDELDHFLPPLLDALEVVHDAGILHRDIKPANIYIREAERTPVLLDFGAAKYAASTAGDQTATTAAIVSKGYSPHEAYSTEAHLQGPWTDIYGLAATLHRGLTGSAPMESTTRIMQDDFVPLDERAELQGRYRPEFLKSLNRALAVMPKDRPQSIAEWRRELYPDLIAATSGSASQPTSSSERAEWHPLSDTPSDATTLYTGGRSRPSQVASTPSSAQSNSSPTSRSRAGALIGEISSMTAATRPALRNAVKNQSPTVLAGWLLAVVGTAGLAAPFLLGGGEADDAVMVAKQTTPALERPSLPSPTKPAPTNAAVETTPKLDPEAERAAQLQLQAEREKQREQQRAAEKQRENWRRERLALQADLARKRSEEASKLAARRATERKEKEQKAEAERLAKLAEEKRLAAEKAAAEKAAADERERQRVAREKAEQERQRIAEEKEKQRLAAEKKEREAREKAAAEAREQERLRLARRAEAAERRRAERAKENDAARERKYAALNPAAPATTPEKTTGPNAVKIDRKAYVSKVQTALKDRQCYSGLIDGNEETTETALKEFTKSYEGEAQTLNVKTASADEYDAWLTWFRSLEKFGCISPRQREEFAKPKAPSNPRTAPAKTKKKYTPKKTYKAKSTPKKKRSKRSASRKKSAPKRSYGAGSTSRSLLRGTR